MGVKAIDVQVHVCKDGIRQEDASNDRVGIEDDGEEEEIELVGGEGDVSGYLLRQTMEGEEGEEDG